MGRKRIKQYLMLLMVIGVVAVVASGSGTFASFSAEVTNPNNTFATGTLFLHNTKGATTCTSESSNDNLSATPACATLFTVANLAPSSTNSADLTLTNAGSVNSADIKFMRSPACVASASTIGTLATNAASTATALDINGLTQAVVNNTIIKLTEGGNSQTYRVTSSSVGPGNATGIVVVPVTNVGGAHTFTTGGTTVTFDLSFTTPALCTSLQMYIDGRNAANTTDTGCVWPTNTPGVACVSGSALTALPSTLTGLTLPLAAGASQNLRLTVSSGSLDNSDMASQASFGLLWHLEH